MERASMEVVITTDAFRPGHFAEIRYGHVVWAELNYDSKNDELVLTIFGPPEGADKYIFPFVAVQDALERAKMRFMNIDYKNEQEDFD